MQCDFLQLANRGVQGLQPYQPGKPVSELEREYGIQHAVKLASNENPLGPAASALAAIQAHLKELTRYPDGSGFALKQALAQKLGVETEMITLGNGSNDVLELIARAFVTEADSVLFSQHAFAVYPLVTQAIGAEAIAVPAKAWGHDLAAMQAAIQANTRLIFIANPNNPTGTWVEATALKQFLAAVPDSVLVVVDEAYFEYVTAANYPNSVDWLAEHRNLIVCRTFSKAYGLAGLRVGYAIAAPDITNILNRVRQPFNVNSMALAAAEAVLADQDYLQRAVALNTEQMAWLTQQLTALNVAYIPSVGNFIAIDIKQAALPIYEALLQQGVIVRPIGGYGMPTHLRVSIGLAAENARFIAALTTVLQL